MMINMKMLLGGISLAVAALMLAGCGAQPIACTEIGVAQGVSLNIAAPLAKDATKALVTICVEEEECEAVEVELFTSTTTESQGCEGDDPDDSCSAVAVPDGGRTGFAPFDGLPESEVEVVVALWDANDGQILLESATVTPARIYPNGPQCDNGGVQLGLTVTQDGIISEVTTH